MLRDTLHDLPLRDSKHLGDRLAAVRHALNASFQDVWREALISARFRSPLLVLDEAHHVKNPHTKLASLFVSDDAREDARMLSGALEGGFERMLFLTATPFQLGHSELLDVNSRFQGIDWKSLDGDEGRARDDSERHGSVELLPNVRLASGAVRPEVRERLLLGFNTPFFPEILVASSVMAEGVDLHLNCRHIVHHDLDWNPSVLEQRTGRVDRINCKAERSLRSIEVALPYVGGTQDEKMYRVVMDRERWFQIVMGEDFKTDEYTTEVIAERVPLPGSVAKELTLRLDVAWSQGEHEPHGARVASK